MKAALVAALVALVHVTTFGGESSAAACAGQVGGEVSADGTYSVEGRAACDSPTRSTEPPRSNSRRTTRPREVSACDNPDSLAETIRENEVGSNTVAHSVSHCFRRPPRDRGPAAAAPSSPPPPAAVEVFQSAPLVAPAIRVNPQVRGLVGLEAWLWWGADVALPTLTVAAGEWSASIVVDAPTLVWDLGNGDVLRGDGVGTGPAAPSLRYVYENVCDCTITLTVRWTGTVTLTHPAASAPIVEAVGPVDFTTSIPYEVEEREAVIVG